MKIHLSWLQEFLPVRLEVHDVALRLTALGLEVDKIETAASSDPILEISLTPNLGHCLSARGIARELASSFPCKIALPKIAVQEKGERNPFQIQIEDLKNCSRYACRVVRGIKLGKTPDWMKKRLETAGMRSINNAIDISNYVMLELGQPLHFFDGEKFSGNVLLITSRTKALSLMTLDEQLRPIPQGTLLICDGEKPIAFAGVMGGLATSVSEGTRNVVLEAAHFSPQAIRKSAKALDLRSESSYRFERGTDPLGLEEALDRAACLLQEICGGVIGSGIAEEKTHDILPKRIPLRLERVNAVLGTHFNSGEVIEMLSRLHMLAEEEKGFLAVDIPTYRNDIAEEIDLVEEVARVFGYQNLPKRPARHISSSIPNAPVFVFEKRARDRLVAEGLQEWITCDLISPGLSALAGMREKNSTAIAVLHPRSVDQSILRTSLLPGLLQTVKYNLDRQNRDLSAFEVGKIHFKEADAFHEMSALGIIMAGKARPYHFDRKPEDVDFFDLKGVVENVLQGLGLTNGACIASHLPQFHPGRQAQIMVGDCVIGALGEVHPAISSALDIGEKVYFAEINLNDLYPLCKKEVQVESFSLYPGSERDWTVALPEEMPAGVVLQAIKVAASSYLEQTVLLDLYPAESGRKKGKKMLPLDSFTAIEKRR